MRVFSGSKIGTVPQMNPSINTIITDISPGITYLGHIKLCTLGNTSFIFITGSGTSPKYQW